MISNPKRDRLLPVFRRLKSLLSDYEPPLVAKANDEGRYELEFDKDYQTTSRRTGKTSRKNGLYFSGIIIQSSYVGLYFMPVYSHPKEFSNISSKLRKMLKGKSCFYVRDLDKALE